MLLKSEFQILNETSAKITKEYGKGSIMRLGDVNA